MPRREPDPTGQIEAVIPAGSSTVYASIPGLIDLFTKAAARYKDNGEWTACGFAASMAKQLAQLQRDTIALGVQQRHAGAADALLASLPADVAN